MVMIAAATDCSELLESPEDNNGGNDNLDAELELNVTLC